MYKTGIIARRWALLFLTLLVAGALFMAALTESYTATTMRLLHYEGSVEIEDESGSSRFVMENARFNSGESLRTGADSTASVSLDASKIVTLDSESRVEFIKSGNALQLNLTDGALFLDVSEKLGDDESLDIHTSTMAVGIRGTIVFVSVVPASEYAAQEGGGLEEVLATDATGGMVSVLGVLEGTAHVSYLDEASGASRTLAVEAGQKATLVDANENGQADAEPEAKPLEAEDIGSFVVEQLDDPALRKRVEDASDVLGLIDGFPADGDWTWEGTVTMVAQSASKLYDGEPLTRHGDVLVYGLPTQFSIRVSANGSRTDAGESANPIGAYTIYNARGEDVTDHFTHIESISGQLVVDPAPITVWTASAEKVYDGTPLTAPEAAVHTYHGFEASQPVWRNTSYVATENAGGRLSVGFTSETLYGVSGVTWVHGTNPLTGEVREIELRAGQRMTVFLSDESGEQSIEFKIEDLSEAEIPEEILRLYAANPALLAQACADTGWDLERIITRIDALPKDSGATIEANSLYVEEGEKQRLMIDATNVRINIDTEITNYNDRALGKEEAHYTPVSVDQSIVITPTGSQTDVGSSPNTYTIDWGNANPSNYVLSEELGTLTVTPASLTVKTGSASKAYDGTALTNGEATLEGLVNGESASVSATGSIKSVGSTANSYAITWGSAKASNYAVAEELGTLTITANESAVTLTSASASKAYDGTPLTAETVTVSGLPAGFSASAAASGSQKDAGSAENTISSYSIFDADGADVTDSFANVKLQSGTLTVTPAEATVRTGSASKGYDGTALTNSEAAIEGLAETDSVTVTATGTITDVGSADNTYTIDWGDTNKSNYTLTESLGKLEVTANDTPITVTANSFSEVYDGTEKGGFFGVTVEGVPAGVDYFADGEVYWRDAGSYTLTPSIQLFDKETGESVDDNFSNIQIVTGTLTVTPADLTITTGSASKPYDGTALTNAEASISGLVGEDVDKVSVTATGTITEVGTADNTCTIDWGEVKVSNYALTETLGTLQVISIDTPITIRTATAQKNNYDGSPLTNPSVSVEGLPEGFEVQAVVTGSQTDVGSSENTLESYVILDSSGNDVTAAFTNVTTEPGTLSVYSRLFHFVTGGSAAFDGKYHYAQVLTNEGSFTSTCSITQKDDGSGTLVTPWGDEIDFQVGYGGKNAGTYTAGGQSITWNVRKGNPSNYSIGAMGQSFVITPSDSAITITAPSASKSYDGTPLKPEEDATVTGLPEGCFCVAEIAGSQTDAGISYSTIASYAIYDAGEEDVTASFTNVTTANGTLTVTARSLTINLGGYATTFDACPHTTGNMSGTYDNGSAITVNNEDLYENYGDMYPYAHKATFTLLGGETLTLQWGTKTEVGTYTIQPTKSFVGNEGNYIISYTNDKLVIQEKIYYEG